MNLTDEEIRIKVAEAMGWLKQQHTVSGRSVWRKNGMTTNEGWDDHWVEELPNYPEDLNACASFEGELKKLGVFSSYLSNLALVCGFNAQGNEAWFKLHAGLEAVCSATARQRCIAFLKTKALIP